MSISHKVITSSKFWQKQTPLVSANVDSAIHQESVTNSDVHDVQEAPQPAHEPREQQISRVPNSQQFYSESSHDKKSQWGSGIVTHIPEQNFGIRAEHQKRLTDFGNIAAATGKKQEEVEAFGNTLFDSIWFDYRKIFESKVKVASRELTRLEEERSEVINASRSIPPFTSTTVEIYKRPVGLKLVIFIIIVVAIVLVMGAELGSMAALRRLELQSMGLALLVCTPVIAFALVTKLIHQNEENNTFKKFFNYIGVIGVVGWLVLFAVSYATTLREDHVLPSKNVTICFVLCQFLSSVAASSWLGLMAAKLVRVVDTLEVNPTWQVVRDKLEDIDKKINSQILVKDLEEGNIATFDTSKNAFVKYGVEAFQRTSAIIKILTRT